MAKNRDPGAGSTFEAKTKGDPLPATCYGEGDDLELARQQAAAGGAPGQADPGAMPFGSGDSAPVDWPSGNTWASSSGQG